MKKTLDIKETLHSDQELSELWDGTPPVEALSTLAETTPSPGLYRKLCAIPQNQKEASFVSALLHSTTLRIITPAMATAVIALVILPAAQLDLFNFSSPAADEAQISDDDLEELVDSHLLFSVADDDESDDDDSDENTTQDDDNDESSLIRSAWFSLEV